MPMVQGAQIQFRYDSQGDRTDGLANGVLTELHGHVRGVDECRSNETNEVRPVRFNGNATISSDHVRWIDTQLLYLSVRDVIPKPIQSRTAHT